MRLCTIGFENETKTNPEDCARGLVRAHTGMTNQQTTHQLANRAVLKLKKLLDMDPENKFV